MSGIPYSAQIANCALLRRKQLVAFEDVDGEIAHYEKHVQQNMGSEVETTGNEFNEIQTGFLSYSDARRPWWALFGFARERDRAIG